MCSGKQRRAAIMARRQVRRERERIARLPAPAPVPPRPRGSVLVDASQLAHRGFSWPAFMQRGYYIDTWYACVDCGKHEVWSAAQQKWWYETAKGNLDSIAVRCKPCRVTRRSGRTISKKNNDNNNGMKAS